MAKEEAKLELRFLSFFFRGSYLRRARCPRSEGQLKLELVKCGIWNLESGNTLSAPFETSQLSRTFISSISSISHGSPFT